MKSRLIYFLIGLMVISTIGIIILQSILIAGSIAEKKQELALQVNDALNNVNTTIEEEEVIDFLEEEFGGVDSLMHDIVVEELHEAVPSMEELIHLQHEPEENIIIQEESPNDQTTTVKIKVQSDSSITEKDLTFLKLDSKWHEKLEVKLEKVDSVLTASKLVEHVLEDKMDKITSIVHHYSYEASLTGDLEDRIDPEVLALNIRIALDEEGISSAFEYGIYNDLLGEYDEAFISEGFKRDEALTSYQKELFRKDHLDKGKFTLHLQLQDQGAIVWGKVWPMILLVVGFTILILISFGYALYFIFKQKRISQVKNDFINNMTHELKTPLASISLAASSIKHPEVIHKKEEVEHFIDIIESEEKRMNSHIERVLNIAALDKGELKLHFEKSDLTELTHAALKNVELSLSESAGHCFFECDFNRAPVNVDIFHLTNAFTNILDNSIKYRREDLKVSIKLTQQSNHYVLSFEDNGIGMTAKEQQLAFDKFYRAESGDIHHRKGFGLGLSYVKSIIEAHQGSVQLRSQVDKGTTIIIQIPKL